MSVLGSTPEVLIVPSVFVRYVVIPLVSKESRREKLGKLTYGIDDRENGAGQVLQLGDAGRTRAAENTAGRTGCTSHSTSRGDSSTTACTCAGSRSA